MKQAVTALCILVLLSGCKKTIEKIQEDKIMDIMVDGQWIITSFTVDETNTTADFNGYKFQYHRNKTVDAIKVSVVERTGNWDGDVAAMTTWADFPGATTPLTNLNGTWHIENNTPTHVLLTQNSSGTLKTMRLDKL